MLGHSDQQLKATFGKLANISTNVVMMRQYFSNYLSTAAKDLIQC